MPSPYQSGLRAYTRETIVEIATLLAIVNADGSEASSPESPWHGEGLSSRSPRRNLERAIRSELAHDRLKREDELWQELWATFSNKRALLEAHDPVAGAEYASRSRTSSVATRSRSLSPGTSLSGAFSRSSSVVSSATTVGGQAVPISPKAPASLQALISSEPSMAGANVSSSTSSIKAETPKPAPSAATPPDSVERLSFDPTRYPLQIAPVSSSSTPHASTSRSSARTPSTIGPLRSSMRSTSVQTAASAEVEEKRPALHGERPVIHLEPHSELADHFKSAVDVAQRTLVEQSENIWHLVIKGVDKSQQTFGASNINVCILALAVETFAVLALNVPTVTYHFGRRGSLPLALPSLSVLLDLSGVSAAFYQTLGIWSLVTLVAPALVTVLVGCGLVSPPVSSTPHDTLLFLFCVNRASFASLFVGFADTQSKGRREAVFAFAGSTASIALSLYRAIVARKSQRRLRQKHAQTMSAS